LDQPTYLPYEPLFVKFILSNRTNEPIAARKPQFLHNAKLLVTNLQGKTTEVSGLTLTTGGGPLLPGEAQSSLLRPSQRYEEIDIPYISPDVMSEPGKYTIQFLLSDLRSNIIDVVIEEPKGIDKQAFEFLNTHGKDVWFGNIFEQRDGLRSMEEFVILYGQSKYGDEAIYQLGKRYMITGQKEKAQRELEKIKNSKNLFIAENVKEMLAKIE
jgi:hypothetical protein